LATSCVVIELSNALLEEILKVRCKEREYEEKDVSSYWIILRKRKILEFEKESTIPHTLKTAFSSGDGYLARQTMQRIG
jgi:hypothetical protein